MKISHIVSSPFLTQFRRPVHPFGSLAAAIALFTFQSLTATGVGSSLASAPPLTTAPRGATKIKAKPVFYPPGDGQPQDTVGAGSRSHQPVEQLQADAE
ncbi:MAG: hypothetical protein AAFY78_08435 [Cyanobacteria bacterium J06648_16]